MQWEHAVPITAACMAWEEGDVPCQRWLWLSWRRVPGWELELGKVQTGRLSCGAGDGSRVEVDMDSRHVP